VIQFATDKSKELKASCVISRKKVTSRTLSFLHSQHFYHILLRSGKKILTIQDLSLLDKIQ